MIPTIIIIILTNCELFPFIAAFFTLYMEKGTYFYERLLTNMASLWVWKCAFNKPCGVIVDQVLNDAVTANKVARQN